MPLKLNIPVKCLATNIAYYCFKIERNATLDFHINEGKVELVQLSTKPISKDFKTIKPTAHSINVLQGDMLYVAVKGSKYKFTLFENLRLQLGKYNITTGLKYNIASSDRNLILRVDELAVLELTLNGITEELEVCRSEITFSCKGNASIKLLSSNKKIGVELCQAYS